MDSIITGVLLVAFVVICVLLVLLVLVQDQDNSGMGGLLGGGNSAAFGSHSASVLTKATVVFVVLFFVVTFAIAKLLPTKADSTDADLLSAAEAAGKVIETPEAALPAESDAKWWNENAEKPAESAEAVVEEPASSETVAQ
ncbi:MAG: preprotein translocase subunit SecG [Treponema sp.]|uniref:preprotein translocase subunit SecG n=1 Tax=Treponema sp. TaxID=166 RepID=UPI001B757900|nr:preprotein translocase subunit SecG [Treponema sp.]MBP3771486.1 preprotein translocase subunit SecG [Treponema sp.]MBQ9282327.1 preprotein translocase subunit SecG [Treponema sp.]